MVKTVPELSETSKLLFSMELTTSTTSISPPIKSNPSSLCLKKEQIEQNNVKLVLKFFDEAFGQHDITAVDRYVSCDYIQHNPQVVDGPQALKDFLVSFNANKKKEPIDIRRVIANDDMVWLHMKTTGFKGEPLAVVDIFRLKDGKLVEHWDVIQPIPHLNECKNSHPMF